jgi:hypothetical protein
LKKFCHIVHGKFQENDSGLDNFKDITVGKRRQGTEETRGADRMEARLDRLESISSLSTALH